MFLMVVIGLFYFQLIPDGLLGDAGVGHVLVLIGYQLFGGEVGSLAAVVSLMTCLGLEVVVKGDVDV
ncbi:hypothetical protein [Rhodoferax antarcticus]|nr:hypothetical protein [Rhodoferax antarcticus]